MSYWRLHYHIILATLERQSTLTPEREKIFYETLYSKAEELSFKVHSAGNTADHVHIVVSIPPKLTVADCVKHIEGASAHAINHAQSSDGQFKWQGFYGALTIGERSLVPVMEYAANQQKHHDELSIMNPFEKIIE